MQLAISDIHLYETLMSKTGQQEAETFIQILESEVDGKLNSETSLFATKEDTARLEVRLEAKISDSKVGIIKWMVATRIGILCVLVAFIKLVQ